VTTNPGFKGFKGFDLQVDYLKNGAFQGQSYKKHLQETTHDLPNGATFNDLE